MAVCASCGRTLPAADRFCGGCGTPVEPSSDGGRPGPVAAPLNLGDADGEVLLEGTVTAGSLAAESEVHAGSQVRWVLLGVLALGLMVFGLSRFSGGEISAEPSESAAETEADDRAGDGDAAADDAREEDGAADDPAEDATGPDTTEAMAADGEAEREGAVGDDPERRDSTDQSAEDEATAPGPVLGDTYGLGVVFGRADTSSEGMRLLDLDTGIVHDLSATGYPIATLDNTIVVRSAERTGLLSLDDPDGEVQFLSNNSFGWSEVLTVGLGRIWEVDGDPPSEDDEGWTVTAYNADAEQVDELVAYPWSPIFTWDPAGELVQVDGGGIYRRQDGQRRRVSTGHLLVAGESLALVRECDDAGTCAARWYTRDNWEPVDLPAPDIPSQGRISLQNDDRWLHTINWLNGSEQLYEVETGRTVTVRSQHDAIGLVVHAPVSPDGRWLVQTETRGLRFVDLDGGTAFSFEDTSLRNGYVAVFVDLQNASFLPEG